MFGTKLTFSRKDIFAVCSRSSSEDLERLEWSEGNFWNIFFGQRVTAEFFHVFFLVGGKNIKTKISWFVNIYLSYLEPTASNRKECT